MEELIMRDGKHVAVRYWEDVRTPRASVVLVHGMCEYISRYDEFCKFLNANGYYVMGMDNRGFGNTDPDALGHGYAGMFDDTVDDIMEEVEEARRRFNTKRVFVIGHSYGSFLTQRFIELYPNAIDGAILCGSALQSGFPLAFGSFLANAKYNKHQDDVDGVFSKFTFEAYDKKLKEGKNAWLNRDKVAVEAYNADAMCNFTCTVGFYKSFFDGIKLLNKERRKVPNYFNLMIASGDSDGVGGYGKLVKKLDSAYRKKCNIKPRLRIYEEGRHEILNEINKGVVYEDFLSFLDDCVDDLV